MKAVVIYNSQSGFTKKYAEWIAEACGCKCLEFKQGSKENLFEYDAVIFGGWFFAAGITKIAWLKKQLPALNAAGKKVIVYVTGGSPADSPDVPESIRRNFTEEEWSNIKTFYCPGGLNYDKMNLPSKLAIKMLVKSIKSKKDVTDKEKYMAETMSHSYDFSDKKYIEPILAELQK